MLTPDRALGLREPTPAAPVSLRLEFSLHVTLPPGAAPSPVRTYLGGIWSALAQEPIGRVEVFVVDLTPSSHPPSELLSREADLEPYLQLYENDQLSSGVQKLLGARAATVTGLFILNRLELLPEVRGKDLGVQVIEGAIATLGLGCQLAALLPFPLQCGTDDADDPWATRMGYATLRRNRRQGVANLKRFYARAQFQPVRGTKLMIRNLVR